jgi:hypothetical protein
MDISKIKAKKSEFEASLKRAVEEFEQSTGCTVERVQINRTNTFGRLVAGKPGIITGVEIGVAVQGGGPKDPEGNENKSRNLRA